MAEEAEWWWVAEEVQLWLVVGETEWWSVAEEIQLWLVVGEIEWC